LAFSDIFFIENVTEFRSLKAKFEEVSLKLDHNSFRYKNNNNLKKYKRKIIKSGFRFRETAGGGTNYKIIPKKKANMYMKKNHKQGKQWDKKSKMIKVEVKKVVVKNNKSSNLNNDQIETKFDNNQDKNNSKSTNALTNTNDNGTNKDNRTNKDNGNNKDKMVSKNNKKWGKSIEPQ